MYAGQSIVIVVYMYADDYTPNAIMDNNAIDDFDIFLRETS